MRKNQTQSTTKKKMKEEKTEQLKNEFIRNYIDHGGNVTRTCVAIGVDRKTPYLWYGSDQEFADRWNDAEKPARKVLAERLREALDGRAVEGVKEPVFYQGQECGYVTKYSDTAAIFLLKGADPETYRERTDVRSENKHTVLVEDLTDEQLAAIAAQGVEK